MRVGIIGGTGVYGIKGGTLAERVVETPFGEALVFLGAGDLTDVVFLARHGPEHNVPPHMINYRANLMAFYQLGVQRIMATFAVGSLKLSLPPGSMVALDQFIDFTHGRQGTFFDGGCYGLAHTDVTYPYCPVLRERLLSLAADRRLAIQPRGTYVAFNGPRLETAAEIRMCARLGGDVVGMTGVPEAQLARELGMHYAAVATSINYAAGLKGPTMIDKSGLDENRALLLSLFVETLRSPFQMSCQCAESVRMKHPPTAWEWRTTGQEAGANKDTPTSEV